MTSLAMTRHLVMASKEVTRFFDDHKHSSDLESDTVVMTCLDITLCDVHRDKSSQRWTPHHSRHDWFRKITINK